MYQSTSFCFFYLIPSKSLPNIHQKSLNNGGKFAEIVMWTNPFQVKSPIKRHIWALILFFTHLLNRCDMGVTDGIQLIQRQLIPDTFGVLKTPKNLAQPKKCGKNKAIPFLNVFEVPDSESEVRILIKNLVLKLSNLMTLFVCNCI